MHMVKLAVAAPHPPRRLTRDDWVEAALTTLAEGGLGALVIEALATRLKATKGSFYWHFTDRDDLVGAALERWLRRATIEVIADLASIDEPSLRLRRLFDTAFADGLDGQVGAALLAVADHPLVRPILERATQLRLRFLTDAFTDLGWGRGDATNRAVFAYTAYVGLFQLRRATPASAPTGQRMNSYLRHVLQVLAAPPVA